MSEKQSKNDLGILRGRKVPSMIRNQNGGMKNKTHEAIKRSTVGEAPMAAMEQQNQRHQKQRK